MNEKASTDTPPRAKGKAAIYRWAAMFVILAATIGGVLLYWRYAALYPSAQVYVRDDDRVASGDPLFDIDATLYDAALRNARAQFDAAASAAGTAADAL